MFGKRPQSSLQPHSFFCPSHLSFNHNQRHVLIQLSRFYPRFLAYGVGLDPRQAKVYGPKYGPVLVGLLVGIL